MGHVIDHHGDPYLTEQRLAGNQVLGQDVEHDVPAEGCDAFDGAAEQPLVRRHVEEAREVAARAAHAEIVHLVELALGRLVADHRDTAPASGMRVP